MKKRINTDQAPGAIGPYSQAVEIDNVVYTSGQLGVDPATGEFAAGVEGQSHQALKNLDAVLKAAGLGLDDVVKTLVFLADMNDFAAFNAIYAEYFKSDVLPARSCVQAAKLPRGGLVEIEAVALKK